MHIHIPLGGQPELKPHAKYDAFFEYNEGTYSLRLKLVSYDSAINSCTFLAPDSMTFYPQRRFYRLSMNSLDEVRMEIGGELFEIVDLSRKGAGIRLTENHIFHTGQTFGIRLILGSKTFGGQGKVKHITRTSELGLVCGVSIEYDEKQDVGYVNEFIYRTRQTREQLFRTRSLFR
jgi:hypothetical protein